MGVWSRSSLLCVGVVKMHPVRDTSCAINCYYLSKEGRDYGIPDWPLSQRTSTMAVVRCVMYIMMGTCDTIRQNSLNRVVRIEYSLSVWRTLLSGTELQGLGFRSGEDVECFCWKGRLWCSNLVMGMTFHCDNLLVWVCGAGCVSS